jgi:glycosyltransferase involved in cell wall biosynthesis
MRKISIVIPVFNEEDSLGELHAQIQAVAQAESNEAEFEVIFIDLQ